MSKLEKLVRNLPNALAIDKEKAMELCGIETPEEFNALSTEQKLKLWRDTDGEDYPYTLFFDCLNKQTIDLDTAFWFLY